MAHDYRAQLGTNYTFSFTGDLNDFKKANNLMTGQEWYNRFEEKVIELEELGWIESSTTVLEVARRVSGIESKANK